MFRRFLTTVARASPSLSGVEGKSLRTAVVGQEYKLVLVARDALGERRTSGNDAFSVKCELSRGSEVTVHLKDETDGRYTIAFTPQQSGKYRVSVLLGKTPLKDSPFVVTTEAPDQAKLVCTTDLRA